MRKRLTKSRSNIVVSGVLGGIGEYIGIDPTILRVIFVIMTLFGAGTPIVLYFILMLIMPSIKGNNYGNPYSREQQSNQSYQDFQGFGNEQKGARKRKEAEKVEDEDWSDF